MRVFLLTIAVLTFSNIAQAYSVEQLAMAIYHAEGGDSAEYPFGIRSVYCGTWTQCKRICEKTIRNNFRRFKQDGRKGHQTYIEYLASHYCPSTGRVNAKREHDNWIFNVNYFLERDSNEKID